MGPWPSLVELKQSPCSDVVEIQFTSRKRRAGD
jgi:hypothetical protein